MSGKFHAHGAFPIQTRGIIAVYGEVTDGVVRPGQIATGPGGFRARVHDVEIMRRPGGEEDLALTFPLPSERERAADIISKLGDCDIALWETDSQADAHLGSG